MNNYIALIMCLVMTGHCLYAGEDRDDWNCAKSTHFIIYFHSAEQRFINRTISEAERCYEEIAEDLGFRRYNFWTWDKRARIYIDDSAEEFHARPGQQAWTVGYAVPRAKAIYSYQDAPRFLDQVLPHEMTHLIFDEMVGYDNQAVPVWLKEGVSGYVEYSRARSMSQPYGIIVKAIRQGRLMSIQDLEDYDLQQSLDQEAVQLYYAQAFCAVHFIIEEFGEDGFTYFCELLRDRRDLLRALRAAFSFADLEEFNQEWMKFIEIKT